MRAAFATSIRQRFVPGPSALLLFAALSAALLPLLAALAPGIDARLHSRFQVGGLFAPLCHQIVERSFGGPLHAHALCARCEGLYLGGALALALAALHSRFRLGGPNRWLLLAAAPTALDVAARVVGLHGLDSPARFGAAIPAGFAAGLLLALGLIDLSKLLARESSAGDESRAVSRAGRLAETNHG